MHLNTKSATVVKTHSVIGGHFKMQMTAKSAIEKVKNFLDNDDHQSKLFKHMDNIIRV